MMEDMIAVNIFAYITSFLIYFNVRKNHYPFFSLTLFLHIVRLILVMLMINVLSVVFNGLPGKINSDLNWIANLSLFLISPLPSILWLLYADFSIFRTRTRTRTLAIWGAGWFAINGLLTFASIRTHWFFYIDAANIYHRGSLIWLHVFFACALLVVTTFIILANRRQIDKKHYISLMLFPVPSLIGSLLQISVHDMLIAVPSTVLAILAVYLSIHEKDVNLDFLTGAFNRRSFEIHLEQRIRDSRRRSGFSLIFLDLDHFKSINDRLGHRVGDEVLQKTVELLHDCLQHQGLLARIGGDEFGIILNQDDKNRLVETVEKIEKAFGDYNAGSGKPYLIEVSLGYDVYPKGSQMSRVDFLKHVDSLMYVQKKEHNVDVGFQQDILTESLTRRSADTTGASAIGK